jgi:spermidine synthase
MVATAGLIAAVAAALALHGTDARRLPAWVVAAANLAAVVALIGWHPFDARIASDKHGPILSRAAKPGGLRTDFSQWSRFGRVDITEPFASLPPQFGGDISTTFKDLRIEQRMLMLDGAAPAFFYRVECSPKELAFLSGTSQSIGYQLRPAPRVLVIGVGGGTDVLIALHHDAQAVTAVELIPVNATAVERTYADYIGNVFADPRVTLVVAEGRNFAARDTGQYDLIQLSGVDTGASQGAYGLGTMPESYIYTVEAFEDLLDRLAPGGILTITRDSRFGWSARVAALAREAVSRKGGDPATSIAVLEGTVYGWATILVKREPFTDTEITRIADFSDRYGFPFAYRPDRRGLDLYDAVIRDGRAFQDFLDLRPSTDDWPFLFLSGRWSLFLSNVRLHAAPLANPLVVLIVNIIGLAVVAVLMIGWPLVRLRAAWRATSGRAVIVGYFALLGAAYILVEVALMQRFTVFLGNPVLAVGTVLAALLIGSGLGSGFARRGAGHGHGIVLVALGSIVLAQLLLAAPPVRETLRHLLWLPLPARLAITIAVVGATGFPMGMPFPFGLARIATRAPWFVAWGWGINGMVSVVSSLVSYLFGMIFGYTAMFYAAAVLYLGALALVRRL